MDGINLIQFLHNYYGIDNKDLFINRLTHQDIKVLFPYIKRTSFEYLESNIELLYSGEIILVYDAHNNYLPYINPHIMALSCDEINYQYLDRKLINIEDIDLSILSKDELLKLRHKLKRTRQYGDEKVIVREIKNKKDRKVMNYKRQKIKLRSEGEYYD